MTKAIYLTAAIGIGLMGCTTDIGVTRSSDTFCYELNSWTVNPASVRDDANVTQASCGVTHQDRVWVLADPDTTGDVNWLSVPDTDARISTSGPNFEFSPLLAAGISLSGEKELYTTALCNSCSAATVQRACPVPSSDGCAFNSITPGS